MEEAILTPSDNMPITNTAQIVLTKTFVSASALSSFITLVSSITYLIIILISIEYIDQSIPIYLFFLVFLFPDSFILNYKVKISKNQKEEREVSLGSSKLLLLFYRDGLLEIFSAEALLFALNGLMKLLAIVVYVNGDTFIAGLALVFAGLFRMLLYFEAQRKINNKFSKIYSFLIFSLSAIMEASIGFIFVFFQTLSKFIEDGTIFLLFSIGLFFMLGIQKIVQWSEKNSIEQRRLLTMKDNLKGVLSVKDPTFGSVIAELPSTLFKLSVIQKVILYSALVLAGVVYVFVIIFLNLEIDPFKNPVKFLLWFFPLIISSVAVLLIISRTEEARVRTSLIFHQLKKALESFEKTNEKYLSFLEEE